LQKHLIKKKSSGVKAGTPNRTIITQPIVTGLNSFLHFSYEHHIILRPNVEMNENL
jgi:hypothetical protein